MTLWWRRSLAAQFIGLMLLSLLISQVVSFLISKNERDRALFAAAKTEFFSRTASVTSLADTIPVALRPDALSASETGTTRFWVTPAEPVDVDAWRTSAINELVRPLSNFIDRPDHFGLSASSVERQLDRRFLENANRDQPWAAVSSLLWALSQPAKFTYFGGTSGFGMAVRLSDGTWLNAVYYQPWISPWWTSQSLISLAVTAVILSLIGGLCARQIARPLRRLAASAEAVGRGENVPPLPENGPDDIRKTTEAFNRMQARLFRFVEDRTRMLAAIGHDLRSPLTSLRLRAEFVNDPETQQRMLGTIDEMQSMTESMIALARGEATIEETRIVDLNALLGSLCDDLIDLGQPIHYRDTTKITYRCRPDGLRRAVRNLIENAVRYAGAAEVSIEHSSGSIELVIADRGPGIPEQMNEKVFAPFFRLENSRSRETGGVGLGLSIARAIARHHGGDITLSSNEPGLRAVLSLPRADIDTVSQGKSMTAAE
jgi:signal transduction histidine kinase